ncbi:MAG: thymidine phosphorylase [Myxococcota bacterium]|nr:thymidine phosphorylase [Myxococcota bacterium]
MDMIDLIRKKRDGFALTAEEIDAFVQGYTAGQVPDYQAAALLMAIFLRGMTDEELRALMEAMIRSGEVLDLSTLSGPKVDKHSTGGVGDKISLHLAPAVAACGVLVPMISGRGLGHSGGTLDKLESIPGFSTCLSIQEFLSVLRRCGLSLIGQTDRLVPADKKLYALRDVTGTVESIPLIAASIMSKKLAEGIDALVLDVKVGSGAFMKTRSQARQLAETMCEIGRRAGKRVTAFLTDMSQPLGRMVGNAAEVNEAVAVLRGRGEPDLIELTRALGGEMLRLGGLVTDEHQGAARVEQALAQGEALRRFAQCALLQGARVDLAHAAEADAWMGCNLHPAQPLPSPQAGYVVSIDAQAVGLAGVELRAGRKRKEDDIDPAAYIRLDRKRGEAVEAGEPLCHVGAAPDLPPPQREAALRLLRSAYQIGPEPPPSVPLILEVLR